MWHKFQKFSAVAVGAAGGVFTYLYVITSENKRNVQNSWTNSTAFIVNQCAKWDPNWDLREPTSTIKPPKDDSPEEQNKYNSKLEKSVPIATRHIILIRHGEYRETGKDSENILTEVGRFQAKYTGERLKALNIKWDRVIASTQTRAQETAHIMNRVLGDYSIENCSLIREGAPIPPEPPVGHWKPEHVFFRDNPRIEAGFRKYFYRADPHQKKDTFTLLVCHANVIRYFVCRALQFPSEAWLRMSLNHASITWISILPSGRVTLRALGDSGHIPPDLLTHQAVR